MRRNVFLLLILVGTGLGVGIYLGVRNASHARSISGTGGSAGNKLKLYWLIPDGLRAEPDVFKIYEWADKGELPNIKRLMEQGAHGYSIPAFPSHTPVNYATLLTGTMPLTHGVADGPIHVEGAPLSSVSVSGFRSVARKIPAVWSLFENQHLKVGIISTPGSTPPEIENGWIVRGRWGGWGQDLHSVNFESMPKAGGPRAQLPARKMFFSGPELTQYVKSGVTGEWVPLSAWGANIFAKRTDAGHMAFSLDGKNVTSTLAPGEWSPWYRVSLTSNGQAFDSDLRFHVIKLAAGGFFRLRVLFNNLNQTVTLPHSLAADLTENVGPMVDFVDNYPPQLIYYPEDEKTFLDEMGFSFDWHTKVISYMVHAQKPDVMIHGIYDPNQMLTSRWWMGDVDPQGLRYASDSAETREHKWADVKAMYKRIDQMVGEILQQADPDTVIVLSSDHGAAPLRRWVKLNNFFARQGWLKFHRDEHGEFVVDWDKTKVIYLQMDGVYINPQGLGGAWHRGSGPEFEKLRAQVQEALANLKDKDGTSPVAKIVLRDDVEQTLSLPKDRVGDLVIANAVGYGWNEEVSDKLDIFAVPLNSGYKQAILTDNKNMWTPFIIAGPGVKKGFTLTEPIRHVDQLPTILKILHIENPQKMDGRVLSEIFR